MLYYGIVIISLLFYFSNAGVGPCIGRQSLSFVRWTGVSPEQGRPVFVYSGSGGEESLAGACLARCRELPDCAGVTVAYGKTNCHGFADSIHMQLKPDNDVSFFKKICLELPDNCSRRWWALDVTPGYHLHSDGPNMKIILNSTLDECYDASLTFTDRLYRSSQWIGSEGLSDSDLIDISDNNVGSCLLNEEDKFTEPESYRVSNFYTFYIENHCRHDYPKKIDRCSYEEYYNQTLKHVELTINNYTKDECKSSCEQEDRFVCRGFTWSSVVDTRPVGRDRGLCDLHSEDLVTTGSWLLRRTSGATYYRRVTCLNISVECSGSDMLVTYTPRGSFRGRVYVPGRGEQCSARSTGRSVLLTLPLYGDCDVNFAHAITNTPTGKINRTMAYVMVMVQNNPIIQTAGDRWVRVGCPPGAAADTAKRVDATLAVRETGKPSSASESSEPMNGGAASAVYGGFAPLTMYVVRAEGGPPGAVSLGEPLYLRIETTEPSEIEAYHLVASSRLGDSSVLLLDSRGCPTGQVDFPQFVRAWLPGGVQRLSARFKAFRFPTSHVVRFSIMVRFCQEKCSPVKCESQQSRTARHTNETSISWGEEIAATVSSVAGGGEPPPGVVAQGGQQQNCGGPGGDNGGKVALELEMLVGSKDILSSDTLVRADHRASYADDSAVHDSSALVCVHELLLVALALTWLAVQIILLLGCCVLVKRYRNLAELSMQKDYHSFDNVGFDTISTHRRVHWPDQNIDILHAN